MHHIVKFLESLVSILIKLRVLVCKLIALLVDVHIARNHFLARVVIHRWTTIYSCHLIRFHLALLKLHKLFLEHFILLDKLHVLDLRLFL